MGALLRPTATVLAVVSCFLLAQIPSRAVQIVEPATPLNDGATFERTIAGGQEHRYEARIKAGTHVSVTVLQRGIDIVVHTLDPGGSSLRRNRARCATEHVAL